MKILNTPPRTIKELCSEALAVQDACNLSGVVHSFSRVMTDLRANLPNAGTEAINRHAVSVLFASKIASLTGSEFSDAFSVAYDFCKLQVNE